MSEDIIRDIYPNMHIVNGDSQDFVNNKII